MQEIGKLHIALRYDAQERMVSQLKCAIFMFI